jgi:hypothetical protein
MCVLTTKNRGAGVPDGGLFVLSRTVASEGPDAMVARSPERGAMEVKGPGKNARQVARTPQVLKYLKRYGKVLVTTYREFIVVSLGSDGNAVHGEFFSLITSEDAFWTMTQQARLVDPILQAQFVEYLKRALLGDAPLSQPADLAWFLAAYAREGRHRLDLVGKHKASRSSQPAEARARGGPGAVV